MRTTFQEASNTEDGHDDGLEKTNGLRTFYTFLTHPLFMGAAQQLSV